ncbi:MAG: hypothetical protein GX217_00255 [Clostridiaceae bacterium]|nr:hypothetical protein [Clostridiaceae bacterium]
MKHIEGYRKIAKHLIKQRALENVIEITDNNIMELMESDIVNESVFLINGNPENCLWHILNGKLTVLVLSTGQIYDHEQIEMGIQLDNGEEIPIESF